MKKSYWYILITAFCFGTMEIVLKVAGTTFPAMQLTFLRFFIGGLSLLPFAIGDLKKRQYKLTLGDWGYLFFLGLLCICFSMYLFQLGIMRTNANMAAIIISMNPVFTMVFAHFLANDKFTRKKAVVLVISLIGLVIVGNPSNLTKGNTLLGMIMVLVASIAFGLYTAYGKRRIAKIGGFTQNSFSFLLGSLVLLVILVATKMPVVAGITLKSLPAVLYLGFIVTGLGYYAFLKAIAISGPSEASIAFFIKPVLAVTLAAIILKEQITANVIVGMAFILAGFILNISKIEFHKTVKSKAVEQ